MNRRQAKKALRKALSEFRTCRKNGYGISIVNHAIVDKNGKPCGQDEEGSRFITYKRPQIKRYKVGVR